MNKSLEISRRILFYFLILSPIIFFPLSKAPFELGRTFFYGIISSVIGIIFFINQKEKIYLPNRNILVYFFLVLVSHIFSEEISVSIFSEYPRFSEGLIPDLIVFNIVILSLNLFKKVDIPKIVFISGLGVITIAVIQSFIETERITSTLGQSNFLGIFSAICVVYTLINWRADSFKTELSYFLYLLLQIYVLVKSASLTSYFSLIIIILILLIQKKIQKKLIYMFVLIVSVCSILFGNILLPKVTDIYYQLKDRNQTTISDSMLIRTALWETTIERSFNKYKTVFFGYGSNYFISEFERHRNSKLNNYSEYNLLFDKPHNYFLEILFSNGLVILVMFMYLVFQSIKIKNQNSIFIVLICLFIFFNWLDIYLKLIFFIMVSQNLDTIKVKNNKIANVLLELFILLISFCFLIADFFYYKNKIEIASKINPIVGIYKTNLDFLYKTKNPKTQIEGLKYFSEKDLEDYKKFLKSEYPENIAIKSKINF